MAQKLFVNIFCALHRVFELSVATRSQTDGCGVIVGAWGDCNETCGLGRRSRTVTCVDESGDTARKRSEPGF